MSTPLEILSFDGYVFADHDWYAGQPLETSRGQYAVNANVTSRAGNTSVMSPGAISPRRITVDIVHQGDTTDLLPAIDELIGYLDPRDQNARVLVANRNGVTVQRSARIEIPYGFNSSGAINVVQVVFVSEDPEWTAQTLTTVDQTGAVSPFSAAVVNSGQATVNPVYQIRWTVQRSVFGTVVGQKYRVRWIMFNAEAKTLAPFPYMFTLGDTAALVTAGKLQADGDDFRVILNGEDMTRQINGLNKVKSFVWLVIPGMDSDEELTVDLIYGNASATNPPVWTDPDPAKPVIDISSESGTATGGSTSTIVKASATWDVNRWKNGRAYILTGAAAGDTQVILSNTATTIQLNGTVSAAVGAGDTFLLLASDNGRWAWGVRQTDRESDYARGRWYLDSPKNTPSVASFDSPGAWRPELINDNRDSMGQKRFSMLTTGGADKDPFAIIDAQRMWEGNDSHVYNAGTADGVAITTPAPIYGVYWAYQFDNPNAMCKAWIGVRGSGSEDWAEAWTDEAATTGLTTTTPALIPISGTFGTTIYQIAMALLPIDDLEIDLTWRRDTGSLTSATTTVSTDSEQEWSTDQFDNGSILMTSGVNKGIKRGITSNTSTAITHAAFPAASSDGDRYVVRNKRLKGRLLDDATLSITFYNNGPLGLTSLISETEVYEISCTLWVGAGPSADPAGQHRALIGWAAGSKRLFLAADERLEIDAALRKIRIYNTTSSTYTGTLTDPMVIVQWHDGTSWKRSANWLPIGPGSNLVWIEEPNMGTLGVNISYYASYLGA